MILKYNDFLTESKICELILESKLIYSKAFTNILIKMKDSKISDTLLSLYSNDIDVSQNYIDITDQKDYVSFTPDRRVQEIIKDKREIWKVVNSGLYLTHSDRNDKIFERLGYDKNSNTNWSPEANTKGIILNETISKSIGKVYVLFKEEESDRLAVLNKDALIIDDSIDDPRIWKTSRNPIKIGRLVRSILTSAKVEFTDKNIEDFTNQYKATFDFISDSIKRFDIVEGEDISYWYDENRYYNSSSGTLGSSCMKDVDSDYFDIYVNNRGVVSLAILYDDNGTITDDKYKSRKIMGRSLLWKLKANGIDITFMDRIYTTHDSDVELFKKFAEKNEFWYKVTQNSQNDCYISNGKKTISPKLVAKLLSSDFHRYPYLDTLNCLDIKYNTISNTSEGLLGKHIELDSTGGGYSGSYPGRYSNDDENIDIDID